MTVDERLAAAAVGPIPGYPTAYEKHAVHEVLWPNRWRLAINLALVPLLVTMIVVLIRKGHLLHDVVDTAGLAAAIIALVTTLWLAVAIMPRATRLYATWRTEWVGAVQTLPNEVRTVAYKVRGRLPNALMWVRVMYINVTPVDHVLYVGDHGEDPRPLHAWYQAGPNYCGVIDLTQVTDASARRAAAGCHVQGSPRPRRRHRQSHAR